MSRALIILAREPKPGSVKSRLARDVGDAVAAELYAAMLEDVLETAAGLDCRKMLFWGTDGPAPPPRYAGVPFEHFSQSGGSLGERMTHAFETAFAAGADCCCIIGSDSPDLPLEYVHRAFDLLNSGADVVFGPADDGGYYLAGMRRPLPELFRAIDWGTENVLVQSLARARQAGALAVMLPPWYDIDTLVDLRRLTASGFSGGRLCRNRAAALLAGQAP